MTIHQLIPTAEPFFLPGVSTGSTIPGTGCLLIHGFTGTPKEMRWMGEYLAEQGLSVLGVRLAGHATHPEDMIRSRWTDWLASVEDGYHLLRGVAGHIYLIGLSMGGVLSLLMSTRLEVKGVVAISTPYRLRDDWRLNFVGPLSRIRQYLPKSSEPPGSGWFDTEAWKDHVSYAENPIRSVGELNKMLVAMHAALPRVRVPVLLVHSKDDGYVPPENLERIYAELVNAPDKTKLYVTGSGHVATRDAARGQVFEAASNFIRLVESQSK
jgi:carboxylesterase